MSNTERPTIVLVPGFMTDSDLWADLIPNLDGYNVVCADSSTGTSLDAIAVHILKQCPPKFILLGFSLGGYVARYMVSVWARNLDSWSPVVKDGVHQGNRWTPSKMREAPHGEATARRQRR